MVTDDPKYLDAIRNLPCVACGRPPKSEAAHIKARGQGRAYGDDWWNLLSLCAWCHRLANYSWHVNIKWFFSRFPHVRVLMEKLGWEFYERDGDLKFVHPAYRDTRPKEAATYKIEIEGDIK
ncbi:hypothetical protein EP01_06925 [Bdellovibrio bacteriovorus]|uniref:HNH endonuclease n=1 Tax=Bdellovibrio bacteriovorus TaxID=959 RepID=UPI00045C17AD|nr:HNH endonuclease [Bdellovibrio bacteriovorus]AHZ84669.1 hypothetical protein EP01_06925 [Bdellovibrio bacteriovorus]